MPASRRNLELKAVDRDPTRSLRTCKELGAEDRGLLIQKDTYFVVPRGRLKLREEQGSVPQLIAYRRPDRPEQRESRYEIVRVEDGPGLAAALDAALGVLAVVRKTRRLFLLGRVRIHLDQVENLGGFIEFEAVAEPGDADLSHLEDLLRSMRASFGIADADLVAGSYCDLQLRSAGVRPRSGRNESKLF